MQSAYFLLLSSCFDGERCVEDCPDKGVYPFFVFSTLFFKVVDEEVTGMNDWKGSKRVKLVGIEKTNRMNTTIVISNAVTNEFSQAGNTGNNM